MKFVMDKGRFSGTERIFYRIDTEERGQLFDAFEFYVEDGVFMLNFAMCTYGHSDYKPFTDFNKMIEYIENHKYVGGFNQHLCDECAPMHYGYESDEDDD